jgi:hypothetical protein
MRVMGGWEGNGQVWVVDPVEREHRGTIWGYTSECMGNFIKDTCLALILV